MNATQRAELALMVQALRRFSVRLEWLQGREDRVRDNLTAAAEHVASAVDHLQEAIERSAARPGAAVVPRKTTAMLLREANERAKGGK